MAQDTRDGSAAYDGHTNSITLTQHLEIVGDRAKLTTRIGNEEWIDWLPKREAAAFRAGERLVLNWTMKLTEWARG